MPRERMARGLECMVGDKVLFLGYMYAKKHQKNISCYKRYKNSRNFLDEKAKYQPWIIKKKPESG
jgi:hypothetical protein